MDTFTIILYAVIATIAVIVLYMLYSRYNKKKVVFHDEAVIVENQHKATQTKKVPNSHVPSPLQGNEYAVSFWVYVNDYSYRYGQKKHILYRGIDNEGQIEANPEIYLHPTENTIVVNVKLQTDTVPDPRAQYKKITVADEMGAEPTPDVASNSLPDPNNVAAVIGNTEETNTVANTNSATNNGGNATVEEFYGDLGSNILAHDISADDMTHNYAIVGASESLKSHPSQIKELFEDTEPSESTNATVNNAVETAINNSSANIISNISGNAIEEVPPTPMSPDFLENNPFIAQFVQQFSQAVTEADRQKVASDYANQFIGKTEDEKQEIAKKFIQTVAKMFAKSMGLEVSDPITEPTEQELTPEQIESQMAELYDGCYIRHIPLQRWTNVCVSVYQNTLDIFMDGKLVSSCNLKGFPQPNKHNIVITPNEGYDGFLSNVKFLNMSVTPEKAMELYYEGHTFSRGFFGGIWHSLFGSSDKNSDAGADNAK